VRQYFQGMLRSSPLGKPHPARPGVRQGEVVPGPDQPGVKILPVPARLLPDGGRGGRGKDRHAPNALDHGALEEKVLAPDHLRLEHHRPQGHRGNPENRPAVLVLD